MRAEVAPTTIPYKQLGDLTLYIDVYPPLTQTDASVPALVYFHGGGMTVGDRTNWFPTWLQSPPSCFSRVCMHNLT